MGRDRQILQRPESDIIKVDPDSIITLVFDFFDIQPCDVINCPCDYVTITDGDKTNLLDKEKNLWFIFSKIKSQGPFWN